MNLGAVSRTWDAFSGNEISDLAKETFVAHDHLQDDTDDVDRWRILFFTS